MTRLYLPAVLLVIALYAGCTWLARRVGVAAIVLCLAGCANQTAEAVGVFTFLCASIAWFVWLGDRRWGRTPTHAIVGRRVVSEPGAAVEVTTLALSDAARRALTVPRGAGGLLCALLLAVLSLTACTATQIRTATDIGASILDVVFDLVAATGDPSDTGRQLAAKYGKEAVKAASELVVKMTPEKATALAGATGRLVTATPTVAEGPLPIGFDPHRGATAGPAGASSGTATAGTVAIAGDPRAVARWLATHPDAW